MNHDSFKQLEAIFHELSELSPIDRRHRLEDLDQSDASKAIKLRSMFASITHDPEFLDPASIEAQIAIPIEIMLDGSTVLADRYTIIECIGVGGSSTVFRARAINPDRDVALKMLRFGLSSQRARDRFEEESKALASLTHPHIAHVYETGVYDDSEIRVPWIAMELVHGSRTIMDYVRSEACSVQQCVGLFTKVCEAIQAAHNAGVLHLDINTSNILVDPHGYPKIIDFGLAGLIYSAQSKNPSFVGTRSSMAPEQTIFGSTPFDERTDVYALGLLFVELLSGHQLQAFDGQSDDEARRLIAMGKASELLDELDGFPVQYRSMAKRMLRVDPSNRYESVDDAVGMLREKQSSKYSRKPMAMALVLVVVIAMAFIWVAVDTDQASPVALDILPIKPNALQLSPDVAIKIIAENPRNSQYSEAHSRVIDGLSTALESSNLMDPIQVADLHATLADNYRIAGGYSDAVDHFERAVALLSDHGLSDDLHWTIMSLVDLLIFLNRIDEAEYWLGMIPRDGDSGPLFLFDLGIAETQIHLSNGEIDQAIRQLCYTETKLDRIKNENASEIIERMLRLGEMYDITGQKKESVRVLRAAQDMSSDFYSESSVSTAMINVTLATSLFVQGDSASSQESLNLIEQAIQTFEDNEDYFHAAWAARQLGHLYVYQQEGSKAAGFYSFAYSQMLKLLGDNHHEVHLCAAYRELAGVLLGDEIETHTTAFHKSIDNLVELLGPDHTALSDLKSMHTEILNGHKLP